MPARVPGHMLMLASVMTMHEACQVTWLHHEACQVNGYITEG